MNPTTRRILVAINPEASFGRYRSTGEAVVSALSSSGCQVTVLVESDAGLLRLAAQRR